MSQLSVLDRVLDYRAAQSLWSTNNSDRVMAATFLRLGDQLEAQWQSNDIQHRLCGIAMQANDMLADMGSSLAELQAGQERTNELLEQSLAVQTEHYLLDKRERVLKDALFRWGELLSNSEGLADPHWVVIACRTYQEFLNTWAFTTEDLRDASEKREFLNLSRRVKQMLKDTSQAVVSEVNVFQALYAEYQELLDPALVSDIKERFRFASQDTTIDLKVMSALMEKHFDCPYPGEGQYQAFWSELGLLDWNLKVIGAYTEERQSEFLSEAAATASDRGEIPLVVLVVPEIGGPGLMLTDRGVWLFESPLDPNRIGGQRRPVAKVRANITAYSEIGDGGIELPWEFKSLGGKLRKEIGRCVAFTNELAGLWRSRRQWEQQAEAATQRYGQATKEEVVQALNDEKAAAKQRINEYLDLHPAVQDFYPTVESAVKRSPVASEETGHDEEAKAVGVAGETPDMSSGASSEEGEPFEYGDEAREGTVANAAHHNDGVGCEGRSERDGMQDLMQSLIARGVTMCECPICQMEVAANCLIMHYNFFHSEKS
jgi:hypothetical protein